MCSNISARARNLAITDRKQRYLEMREYYKEIVAEYFRRRFVGKDYVMPNNTESGTKMIWSPFHYPILVIGMLVYDEVFIENAKTGMGWDQWDPLRNEIVNYRWTQFEWLWGNTLDSMRLIRC